MRYVKLIENKIEFAPKNKGSILNYDLDIEQMLADGYKPFVEVERPQTNRFYHIEYAEIDTQISEVLVYDETQEEADERELAQAKESKQQENVDACNEKRYNQEFTVELQEQICSFDTSEQTQRDLLTASAFVVATEQPYENWVCNNGVVINLTAEDIQEVFAHFFAMVSPLYTIEKQYTEQIEACSTVDEINAIELNYEINEV